MSDDLIASLRALAAAQHSDLTVAADAADRIERLRAENARLRAQIAEYFAEPATHPVERAE